MLLCLYKEKKDEKKKDRENLTEIYINNGSEMHSFLLFLNKL